MKQVRGKIGPERFVQCCTECFSTSALSTHLANMAKISERLKELQARRTASLPANDEGGAFTPTGPHTWALSKPVCRLKLVYISVWLSNKDFFKQHFGSVCSAEHESLKCTLAKVWGHDWEKAFGSICRGRHESLKITLATVGETSEQHAEAIPRFWYSMSCNSTAACQLESIVHRLYSIACSSCAWWNWSHTCDTCFFMVCPAYESLLPTGACRRQRLRDPGHGSWHFWPCAGKWWGGQK